MPTKVVVTAQVRDYQRSLAPEPRRHLKQAILGLSNGRGDIRALTDNLSGFNRLRVGQHRVIYRYHAGRIECFYAAPRATVYEFLSAHIREFLGQ